MVFTLLMVLYVVLAVFMIGFILIQRGAGAAAGSGFGAGASATVFGARGASSFLTKATKWMAIAFFILTLSMAVYIQRTGLATRTAGSDLGVMSGITTETAEPAPAPAASAPAADVPAAPQTAAPADAGGDVPQVDAEEAAPAMNDVPAASAPSESTEADGDEGEGNG